MYIKLFAPEMLLKWTRINKKKWKNVFQKKCPNAKNPFGRRVGAPQPNANEKLAVCPQPNPTQRKFLKTTPNPTEFWTKFTTLPQTTNPERKQPCKAGLKASKQPIQLKYSTGEASQTVNSGIKQPCDVAKNPFDWVSWVHIWRKL